MSSDSSAAASALLFADRLAPITSELGFLAAAPDQAAEAFVEWQQPLLRARGVTLTVRMVAGGLREVLQSLLPLTSVERRRYLFVPTVAPWTAFFDNGHQGTDAASAMPVLSQRIGCPGMRVLAVPHTIDRSGRGRYGGTILEVYGPE